MATFTNNYRNYLLLGGAALAFGGASFIYLCFCSTDLYLYDWFGIDVKSDWIQNLRMNFSSVHTPTWLRYNLPDALWLFAYLLIIETIWTDKERLYKNIFIYGMVSLAIFAELLQYYQIISGSADWWDVFSYLMTLLTFYLFKYYEN